MEGLENGYDDYGSLQNRIQPDNASLAGSAVDDEEAARAEEERLAEKRKRKEERAVRRERKESRRLAREERAANEGKDGAADETEDQVERDDEAVGVKIAGATAVPATNPEAQELSEEVKTTKKKKRKSSMPSGADEISAENHHDSQISNGGHAVSVGTQPRASPNHSQDSGDNVVDGGTPASQQIKGVKRKDRKSDGLAVDVEIPVKKRKSNANIDDQDAQEREVLADPILVQPSSPCDVTPITRRDSQSFDQGEQNTTVQSGSAAQSSQTAKNVFAATPKNKRARISNAASGTPKKDRKETDEELKRKFRDESAMHAWLAEQWRDLKELARLESLGILKYVRGKFTNTEKESIKAHLEIFKKINRVDQDELVEIIMGKGRKSTRQAYPKFWPEVAAQAPGRPVKAVKDFVKREYDPRGYKGQWTRREDQELIRAYNIHPNEWARIANIVDRTETDCRDRYRNELQNRDTRIKGSWDSAEERKLVRVIKELNEQVGNEPLGHEAPWDLVSNAMDNTRTRTQCRKKWQDQLRAIELSKGEKATFQNSDRGILIQRLKRMKVDSEGEVKWADLATGYWASLPITSLRGAFWRMKKELSGEDQQKLKFGELLNVLAVKYPVKERRPEPKRVSLAMISTDDENEYESEEKEEGEVGAGI